ncbi:unnamed protein product [Anisakis simplex]|uniref:DNA topoisomerase (ATP-hydrolyzing) n=1 Tax=Anisakis simplex TaxID=6269 RepID=A0A0M3J440_ANISI|nr:unnamed protein product [Anisakis simplex]
MDDSSAKKKKAPAAKKTTKASGSGDKPAKAPAKPRANSKKKEGNSSMNGRAENGSAAKENGSAAEDPLEIFTDIDKQSKNSRLSIERIYQKKSQLEHILLRPDTYIGSVERTDKAPMWVYDAEQERIVQRDITYVPGLFKIFDEILVNAADNKQRDPKMNLIKVTIDKLVLFYHFDYRHIANKVIIQSDCLRLRLTF